MGLRHFLLICVASLTLGLQSNSRPVHGIVCTWGGNAIFGGSNWSTDENWFDNAVPRGAIDSAHFRRWDFGPARVDPFVDFSRDVRGVQIVPGTGIGGIPIFTFGGSELRLGFEGIDVLSGSGSGHTFNNNLVLLSNQIWTIDTSLNVNGNISGSAFIQKGGTGTLRLSGIGSWTSGGYTIRQGTVQVAGGDSIPDSATVLFFQDANVPRKLDLDASEVIGGLVSSSDVTQVSIQLDSFRLTINGGGNFQSGVISGTGGITKSGIDTLTISTSNTYSGTTIINAGELAVASATGTPLGLGTVSVEGTGRLSGFGSIPGAVQTSESGTVAGDFTFGEFVLFGGFLEVNWLADPVTVEQTATLASGTIRVIANEPIDPPIGTTWTFIDAADGLIIPALSDHEFDLPGLPNGKAWKVNYGGTTAWLEVIAAPPGDYNGDGNVDAADYVAWRKNNGTQEGYDAWRTNFGRTAGGGSGAAGSPHSEFLVPEPFSCSLALAVVMTAVLGRRSPRSSRIKAEKRDDG
jgi:autotransporter-associated beta strand protein